MAAQDFNFLLATDSYKVSEPAVVIVVVVDVVVVVVVVVRFAFPSNPNKSIEFVWDG